MVCNAPEDKYKVGLLSLFYWGATLMWFVDHVMPMPWKAESFLS
jgi:hypothetical protein